MSKFKKSLLAFGLGVSILPLALTSGSAFAATSVTDKVVATYDNNNLILLSDIKPYFAKGVNVNNPTVKQVHKATEAYLIAKLKRIWQAKAEKEVKVTNDEVENVLYSEAAKHGLTYDDFLKALAYQGMNVNTLKENIRKSIYNGKMNAYLSENVKTQLDREAIERDGYHAYQDAKAAGRLAKTPSYDVSYIVIKTNPLTTEAQVRDKIVSVKKMIDNHEISFSDAAYKYSDDLISAAKRGKLGVVAELPEAELFNKQLSSLKVGQISKPFPVPNLGWVIVRYDGKANVEAGPGYYINKVYQQVIKDKYSDNTLETFLLNSVVVRYVDEYK